MLQCHKIWIGLMAWYCSYVPNHKVSWNCQSTKNSTLILKGVDHVKRSCFSLVQSLKLSNSQTYVGRLAYHLFRVNCEGLTGRVTLMRPNHYINQWFIRRPCRALSACRGPTLQDSHSAGSRRRVRSVKKQLSIWSFYHWLYKK